jgi:uncharacterized protein YbjT (DUF2867 family)
MGTILVTGATGNVGSRLVKRLVAQKAQIRAFVRKGDKGKLPAGVEAFEGDLSNAADVKAAMKGVSKVFLLTAGTELTKLEANVIDAAKEARVEHIVKQSTQGAEYEGPLFAKWHRASEKRIEQSGIPYTFLRPASIATNALEWAGMLKNGGTVYGPYGTLSMPIIDADDIAAVAEAALTQSGHTNKAYEITGPASLTVAEQVAIIGKVTGKPAQFVNVSDEMATKSMTDMGMPPPLVEAIMDLAKALRPLGKINPNGTVKQVLGREPRSFEQFIRDHAGVFA